MKYKKTIKLAKDYKGEGSIVASVFFEYNFDKLYIEICPINNCNLYTHLLIFNEKNAKLCEKCNNIVTISWVEDYCDIALININTRGVVGSTIDTNEVHNFREVMKNSFAAYLNEKKMSMCESRDMEDTGGGVMTGEQMSFGEEIYCPRKRNYLDKEKIDRLLSKGQTEKYLMKRFANSMWRKIYVAGNYYVFGVIYKSGEPEYVGVGVPVITRESISENLKKFTDFFPARENNPLGFGYYLGFKDVKSGENVKLTI